MSFMGKIDRETTFNDSPAIDASAYNGGRTDETVDHAASAKANLEAVGDDLKKGFTPDKIGACIEAMRSKDSYGMGFATGLVTLPLAIVADVGELALMPLVAVKDAADAAIHGIMSLFKKRNP